MLMRQKKISDRAVLLVDDEPYVLSALSRALMNLGFLLVTASSTEEAIRLIKTQKFQVVVSDYDMPRMRGPEFLEQVRQLQPSAIRVVLTGSPDIRTVRQFLHEGKAIRYLLKPWDVSEVVATLNECFDLFQERPSK